MPPCDVLSTIPRVLSVVGLVLLLGAPGLVGAQTGAERTEEGSAIETRESRIVAATLFSTRARITREVTFPPSEGVVSVRIGPLPAILDEAGVQAEGESHHRVLSVQVERTAGGDQSPAGYRELEARIEELQEERGRVARRLEAALARGERFRGLEVLAPPRTRDATDPAPVDPDRWQSFFDLVVRGMDEAWRATEESTRDLEARDRELRALGEELAQIAAPGRRARADAIVTVQDLTGAGGTLRLHYEVPLALWYPEYAVRIDPAARRLEISTYGVVHQRTGENWPSIPVRFSTAIPEAGAGMPELASLRIRRERYEDLARVPARSERAPKRRVGGEDIALLEDRRAFAPEESEVEYKLGRVAEDLDDVAAKRPSAPPATAALELERVVAGLSALEVSDRWGRSGEPPIVGVPDDCVLPRDSSRGFLRTFVSSRSEAVPSDGAPHRLLIGRIELPFTEEHRIVPELLERAFRRLRAPLAGDDPCLDGRAAIFLDGAYLGESRIPTTAPGEEIILDLGVDERVSIVRRQEDREEEVGVFSKARRYHTEVTIELVNHHAEAKRIDLRERIPFTENRKIEVVWDRDDTRPAPSRFEASSGLFAWEMTLPPGESRTVTLRYRIDAPRDYQLSRRPAPERGEEDPR